MISREPLVPFDAVRGLRQGDSMPSFLFVVAMEYSNMILNDLKSIKNFKYHPRYSKLGITHLSFDDDLLLFARCVALSVAAIHQGFIQFTEVSRMHANLG